MRKEIIELDNVESLDVPLSRAVVVDNLVFVSGTVSQDLQSGKPLFGTIEEETEQVLRNLETILVASGSSMSNVVKTTVFLTEREYFGQMNEVYKSHFRSEKPARSTVICSLAVDYKVEIEAIAYRSN